MYFFVGATLSPRATTVVGEFVGWLEGECVGGGVGGDDVGGNVSFVKLKHGPPFALLFVATVSD